MQPAVLIVDDVPANLLALDAALEPLGIETVRANSGEEAVRLTASKEFAAVLMDVRMPGMDGVEAATVIRRRPQGREVPIVLVSAIDRELVHIERGYQAGAIDYLVKPVDQLALRAKVSALVDLWRARQIEREENDRRIRALEANEAWSRSLRDGLDALDVVLWITDGAGQAVYGNRLFLHLGGEVGGDEARLACLPMLPPEDRAAAQDDWARVLAGGVGALRVWRVPWASGPLRPYTFRFQPIPGGAPPGGWICLGHAGEPQTTSDSHGRLLSWLGHELRNPLAALSTVMELRQRRDPGLLPWEQIVARQVGELRALASELARLEQQGGDPPAPVHGRPHRP